MEIFYTRLSETIRNEIQTIDIEGCDISLEESKRMTTFLKKCLFELRDYFLSKESLTVQQEITFFKEMKPEVLGLLLFFNKIHIIELKRPNGSNDTQKEYYEAELRSLTFFFERHLDFYQYYRAKSTYLDEYYFIRGKSCPELCGDSIQFIHDPLFSTGFDYKIAKIISNEMLRIYLNQKMHGLDKQTILRKNRALLPESNLTWTAPKIAAIELGYSLHSAAVFNNGNADVKEIMIFLEATFNVDLGDYYRGYIAIKNRKKDRTPFLKSLIDRLLKRMEDDDLDEK